MVHLEFLPWSRIPDLATAWQVVRAADRPNGGLTVDAWHYSRSGPDRGAAALHPGRRPSSASGCCWTAPAVAGADPLQATLHERLLPGDGELDLRALLADLREAGAGAPISMVFSDALHALYTEGRGPVGRGVASRSLAPADRQTSPRRQGQ